MQKNTVKKLKRKFKSINDIKRNNENNKMLR